MAFPPYGNFLEPRIPEAAAAVLQEGFRNIQLFMMWWVLSILRKPYANSIACSLNFRVGFPSVTDETFATLSNYKFLNTRRWKRLDAMSRPLSRHAIHKILVIKNKHFGDVICSIPAIQALHSEYSEARVDVLVSAGMSELLTGLPSVGRVLEVPAKTGSWSRVKKEIYLAFDIMRTGYDLVVDLTWSDRAMWYALLSRAPSRWAIQVTAGSFLKPHIYTNYGSKPDKTRHLVEWELDFLKDMGVSPKKPVMSFPSTDREDETISAWLAENNIHPDRLVVVHPTSRWLFKCWHNERVAAVIDWLNDQGWQPVLTCGPSQVELERARRIHELAHSPLPTRLGDLRLKELAALMRRARFFFGMDSAPAHLAAAVGIPAVVLFGPSQLQRWRPYGNQHLVISRDCPCQRIKGRMCDKTKITDCLSEIHVEDVCHAIGHKFPPPRTTGSLQL